MSWPKQTLNRLFTATPRPVDADAELLTRYTQNADEAAFTLLVTRHAGMVYRVCRGVLGNEHDAEDATQAAFLVLARNAGTIRRHDSAASWLHGVALRTAGSYRRRQNRRKANEAARLQPPAPGDAFDELSVKEAREILHVELDKLPVQYKEPLIRIYLEDQSHEEAAAALGVTPTVFRGRLERARGKLAERLEHRRLTLAAVLTTALVTMSVPKALAATTAGTTLSIVAGGTGPAVSAGILSPVAANVAAEITAATAPSWTNTIVGLGAATILGGGAAVAVWPEPPPLPQAIALVRTLDKPKPRPEMQGRLLTANVDTFFLTNAANQGAHAVSPPTAGRITRFAAGPTGTDLAFEQSLPDGTVQLHRWDYADKFPGADLGPATTFFWSIDGEELYLGAVGKLERLSRKPSARAPVRNFPTDALAVDAAADVFLIAVPSNDGKTAKLELWNPTSGDRTPLPVESTAEQAKFWRFHPDGDRIAGPLTAGIEVLTLATKERKRLPGTPLFDFFGWSADGTELIVGGITPVGFPRILMIRLNEPDGRPKVYQPGLSRTRIDGTSVNFFPTWAGRP